MWVNGARDAIIERAQPPLAHAHKYNARARKMATCTYGHMTEGVLDLRKESISEHKFFHLRYPLST